MDDDNFSKITRFLNQKFGKYASISMTNRDLRADPIARTRIDQWYLVSEGRKIFSIHAIRNKIETTTIIYITEEYAMFQNNSFDG